ncbi:MAG: cytochrome c [Pseudomonadota bacterium]
MRFHAIHRARVRDILLGACAFGLLVTTTLATADGDADRGRVKAYTCTGCHGIPGYNNAYPNYHVPKIGGQNYQYLIAALKAYRDGQRQHPTMVAQAGSMSDGDIEDIAAYFVSLAGTEPKPEYFPDGSPEAGAEKNQLCLACHGEDGNGIDPQYPRLAGQYGDYMVKALQDYRSGERVNAVMAGFATNLSDKDMADLAAYYAAKPGLVDLKIK